MPIRALPNVKTFKRAHLEPGEVVVLEVTGHVNLEDAETLRTSLRKFFPKNEIIVCGDGLTVQVIQPRPDVCMVDRAFYDHLMAEAVEYEKLTPLKARPVAMQEYEKASRKHRARAAR